MIETWMKVANVARMSRHVVNTTNLNEKDLPADLLSFITSNMLKIVDLDLWEREQLKQANTMPIEVLQTIVDELWSGWVRTKLAGILEVRKLDNHYKKS